MKYLALILLIAGGYALYLFDLTKDFSSNDTRVLSQLEQTGEKCMSIRDRATANIVPIVEFQQLELESRRATVFASCMKDHGFSENPAWLKYAEPLARQDSTESGISYDEALENFRRSEMLILTPSPPHPMYWADVR